MASGPRTIGSFLGQVWFPAALFVLFLLAIPGIVLFVLTLLGEQGEVNDWLQEKFQLTYHLPLPWGLSLLLLLVPFAIIVLYFLKLKRKALQVPSTFLWRKSIEDLHVNSLLQWLRNNILLLLQLLIVLVLIYTVMGFRVHGNVTRGKHYIIMIDNSASMAATDVPGSRLEWAKEEAIKEIDAATDEDVGMVIVFNSKASTLQTYTTDRGKLRDAVRGIRQTQRTTRIEEALILADSLANPLVSTEDVASRPENEQAGQERTYVSPQGVPTDLFLFSDGRFPDPTESALANLNSRRAGNTSPLGNLNLHFRSAGKPGLENVNNVGIVGFNALRLVEGIGKHDDPNAVRLLVIVRVRNFRTSKATAKLRLDVVVDGRVVHPEQRVLVIEGRVIAKAKDPKEPGIKDEAVETTEAFRLPPLDLRASTVLHAYLEGQRDHLPLDDQAWLVVGMVRKAKVLIAGPPSNVLDAFFEQEATRKVASVQRLTREDLEGDAYKKAARSGEFDLVIFDRCSPADVQDMPLANTFFIGDVPPPWERGSKTLKHPLLMVSAPDHPLLQGLSTLWDIGTSEAFRFHPYDSLRDDVKGQYRRDSSQKEGKPLPSLKRLIEAGQNTPILFTLPRGSYQDLVLTFPLLSQKGDLTTNWPLQPSFPLFMRNVLYVLGNVRDAVRAESVQPGEPAVLRPEAGVKEIRVSPPHGSARTLERGTRPEFTFIDTEEVGVYEADQGNGVKRSFAVNLLDPQESNIEPRIELLIGGKDYKSGDERPQPHEIWKWIVLLALGLLLLEWYVYNRRVYA